MKKTGILEGTLDEFFEENCPEPEPTTLEGQDEIRKAFAGKLIDDPTDVLFRVSDADKNVELFFNDREMLARFTSLTKPDQEFFADIVRKAMKRGGVGVIRLTVQWSKDDTKVVTITKVNNNGPLDIYI